MAIFDFSFEIMELFRFKCLDNWFSANYSSVVDNFQLTRGNSDNTMSFEVTYSP